VPQKKNKQAGGSNKKSNILEGQENPTCTFCRIKGHVKNSCHKKENAKKEAQAKTKECKREQQNDRGVPGMNKKNQQFMMNFMITFMTDQKYSKKSNKKSKHSDNSNTDSSEEYEDYTKSTHNFKHYALRERHPHY
jgi:hypothetical protein